MAPKRSTQPPPPASPDDEKQSDSINEIEEDDDDESESQEEEEEKDSSSEEEQEEQQKKPAEPSTKPQPKKQQPVVEEEEDEEEDDEQEEEEDESDDEDKTPLVSNKPSAQKPIQTPNPQLDSSSEYETGEGSDSDSDALKAVHSPTASDFIVKHNVSKPMEEASNKSKRPTLKPAPASATPSKPQSGAKRPVESEQNGKDSKRKKVSKEVEEDLEKKSSPGINRLWSLDDEVAILRGMIDYQKEKGADPYADMVSFHEFIKKKLHVDVSKNQLTDKIRRLKKKYQNNAPKVEVGKASDFPVPHDNVLFELSRMIWGAGGSKSAANWVVDNSKSHPKNANKSAKVDNFVDSEKEVGKETMLKEGEKKGGKEVVLNEEGKKMKGELKICQGNFCSKYPRLSESFEVESSCLSISEGMRNIVKENLSLIQSPKAKQLEEKWNSLRLQEVELYSKRATLIAEQTKMLLDALKSSRS